MSESNNIIKRCTKCGETKSVENFGNQKIRKDGLNPWCKSCKSIAGKKHYEKNKQAIDERHKIYAYANKERFRDYRAAYYQANRVKLDAINSLWYKNNPEFRRDQAKRDYWKHKDKRNAASRIYHAKNKDIIRERARNWRKDNKEVHRALSRSYKARKKGAFGSHTGKDIKRLFELQKGRCIYCKKTLSKGYHVDHVMPLLLGGSNNPDNLQLLCPSCNMSKGAKHPIDFANQNGLIF